MFSFAARARATMARISPQVWRVLAHSLLFGLAGSIADLLFNFYLVSLGYGADTAGLMATVYRGAGALLGLPLGVLIDRFGARALLVAGAVSFGVAFALLLMVSQLWALILIVFLAGAANVLALTAVVPLLTGITSAEERAAVFGMNASAGLIIGLFGSSVGGLLPGAAALILGVEARDTAAYRLALSVVVVLGCISVAPVLIGFRARPAATHTAATVAAEPQRQAMPLRLLRLALPSLLLGIGGGLFLPFQNLFFRTVFGLNDAVVGVMLALGALGMGLGALMGAPVAARLGLRRASSVLRFGAVFAVLLMLTPFLPIVVAGYMLRGAFIAASYPLNDALVMQLTPAQQRGIAVSLMSVLWSLGWSASAWVSGQIQVAYGFTPVLAASLVAYALSAWAIWTIRESQG
ncbi:MAG: MFS transporter [Roseiflexaceae bacterium]|nr:MFS transporter [Roseiflexaceae bacterium]